MYIIVMSPSRAGSSHSWSWRIFGSSRGLFHFSSKSKIGRKRAEIGFSVEDLFLIIFYNILVLKMTNYAAKSYHLTLKRPFVLISLHKVSWNWLESCYRNKIGKFYTHIVMWVLSARFQLKNWSAPAWLSSAQNLHSSGSLELENSSSNSSLVSGVRKRHFLMIYSTLNHQRVGWLGLKKSRTWWRNTWMVPYTIHFC